MFVHVGQENYINLDHVFAVVRNKGNTAKKIRNLAIREKRLFSLTGGYATRTLIVMDSGVILTSAVSSKTLNERFNTYLFKTFVDQSRTNELHMTDENTDDDEFVLDEDPVIDEDENEEDEDEEEELETADDVIMDADVYFKGKLNDA